MVIFNDLRITEDKKRLIVDCQIEDVDGYDSFYIDSVVVVYYANYSDQCVGTPTEDTSIILYQKDEDDPDDVIRAGRWALTLRDLTDESSPKFNPNFGTHKFDGELFFVYVRVAGGSGQDLYILNHRGCGADRMYDVGVVLDWHKVYEQGIAFAAKLGTSCANPCEDPSGFEQFILHWYGLQLAIATCDWYQVTKLWPKFIRAFSRGVGNPSLGSGCGCFK